MKTLVLLTYTFPPLSSGGTPVVLNLSKYLPENDWKVIVVTVENPKGMKTDKSLIEAIPKNLKVIRVPHGQGSGTAAKTVGRTKSENPLIKLAKFIIHNYILIPDRVITWRKQVLPVLKNIITKEKPQTIMSFGPHHSLHLIALDAAAESFTPVIPFFGDLWLADSNVNWPSKVNRFIESLLERKVVKEARAILATTEHSTGYFVNRYVNLCPPVHVVENAYDPDRIKITTEPTGNNGFLVAGWTGNFFANHKPTHFLEGLKLFFERNLDSKLRVKMAGQIDGESLKLLQKHPLKNKVTHHGHLNWDKVPAFQKNCDILIGYITPRPYSKLKNSSKTAEYLMSGRSILGIVPEGAMAERIRKLGRGYIVKPDAEDIAVKLESIEYQWRTSSLDIPVNISGIEQKFSAVNVMKKLAGFLDEIVGP